MTAQLLILGAALATASIEAQATAPPASKMSAHAPDDRAATVPAPAMVTMVGCVATEREINGGPTGIAERIGLNDRFVLTSARTVKGRGPSSAASPGRMYTIAGLSDEQLKPHLGRRVRIEGSLAKGDGAAAVGQEATLPVLTASTVRQIAGECPAPRSSEN